MENELLNYLRDLGAKIISIFTDSQKQSKEQHEELRSTIADEAITTRNLIKALDEAEEKPEPPEKIDLTPIIKSQEAEANFTRKTIEAGTKEIEKLTKVTESSAKELTEASKSISKAVESFKVTIPPQKEFQFPKLDFKVITEPLSKLFSLVKEGFNSMLARGTKEDPIYVKHLDPEGNPVDPSKVIAYGGASSSSGGGYEVVGVKDADNARINPMTEEKGTEIVTAIENIVVPPPVGGATEETLAQVESTSFWLKTLIRLLKPLSIVTGGGSNRLSVDVNQVTTVSTVSSVSAVQNQVNMGNVSAFTLQQAMLRNAFANGIRRNIV